MEINQQKATTCNHFSIRRYVSQMRNKDESVCMPFSMSKEKTGIPLPPLYVAKFKWYQCQACLEADGTAMVPNINTSTSAEARKDGATRDRNLEVITCPRSHSIVSNDRSMIQANHEDEQGNQIHPSNTQKETALARLDSQTGGSDRHVQYRYVEKGKSKQSKEQVGLSSVPKFRDKIGSSLQMYTRRRGRRRTINVIHVKESSTVYHEAIPIPDLNEKIPSNNTSPEHEMHNLISQVEDKSSPRHEQLGYPSTHNGDSTNDIRDGERALQLSSTGQGKRILDFDLNCACMDPDDLDEHNNFDSFACEGWEIDLNREAPESP